MSGFRVCALSAILALNLSSAEAKSVNHNFVTSFSQQYLGTVDILRVPFQAPSYQTPKDPIPYTDINFSTHTVINYLNILSQRHTEVIEEQALKVHVREYNFSALQRGLGLAFILIGLACLLSVLPKGLQSYKE